MPKRTSKTGSELFIVDNSDDDWKVQRLSDTSVARGRGIQGVIVGREERRACEVMRHWAISSVVILAALGTACSKGPQQPPEQRKRTGDSESIKTPQTGEDYKPSAPDKEVIAKFLMAYYNTPFADRGKYVLDPEEFEKGQETYYKGQPIIDEVQTVVSSVKAGPKADYLTVVERYSYTSNGKKVAGANKMYLVNTKNGLKVDWAANTGYNPVGFMAWAAGTDDTLTLRVTARLSDWYYYRYSQAQATHYSVEFRSVLT
jgi:hypothetical protein